MNPGSPIPQVVMTTQVPMLSDAWRVARVLDGDAALERAIEHIGELEYGPADRWVAIAQAHYAAANVRSSGRYGQVMREQSADAPGRPADTPSVQAPALRDRVRSEGTIVIGGPVPPNRLTGS